MLKVHTKNGQTETVDLNSEEQVMDFIKKLKNREYQKSITGMSILHSCGGKIKCPECNHSNFVCINCNMSLKNLKCKTNWQNSLTRPTGFKNIRFVAEKVEPNIFHKNYGGQKIICFVDGCRISLMDHNKQPASRITLVKTGKQRYNPILDDNN